MNATPESPIPEAANAEPHETPPRGEQASPDRGASHDTASHDPAAHDPAAQVQAASSADTADSAVDVTTLVEKGQGLVRSIAMQVFRGLPVRMELDDLIAYGQIGLTEAAQKFDPGCGTRFTTFAYYRIRGAIYDGVSKMNWTSRARIRRMRFHRMADEVLEKEAESEPATAAGDASWLGRVTEKLAIVYLATGEDESADRSLAEAPDRDAPPSQLVANRELQQTLRDLVDRLAPDAKRLITAIYFDGYTLTEAADRSGISKSWASRLHARSLDELAKMLRKIGSD